MAENGQLLTAKTLMFSPIIYTPSTSYLSSAVTEGSHGLRTFVLFQE